jgi:hypothetical protein
MPKSPVRPGQPDSNKTASGKPGAVQTAPAGVAATVICPVSCGGSPCSLVIPDPAEVCPLSRGVMLQPLSRRLRPGIRFLHHPLPAALSARLAARFPLWEGYGLTVFRTTDRMDGVGPLFSPMVLCAHDRGNFSPCAHHVAFWLKPVSTFGLFCITAFIREFTYIDHAVRPWPPTCRDAGRTTLASRRQWGPKTRGTLLERFTRLVTSSHY